MKVRYSSSNRAPNRDATITGVGSRISGTIEEVTLDVALDGRDLRLAFTRDDVANVYFEAALDRLIALRDSVRAERVASTERVPLGVYMLRRRTAAKPEAASVYLEADGRLGIYLGATRCHPNVFVEDAAFNEMINNAALQGKGEPV